jgi:hypothetical protein
MIEQDTTTTLPLPSLPCPQIFAPRLTDARLDSDGMGAQTRHSWFFIDFSFADPLPVLHVQQADHTNNGGRLCANIPPDLVLRSFQHEEIAQLIIQRQSSFLLKHLPKFTWQQVMILHCIDCFSHNIRY